MRDSGLKCIRNSMRIGPVTTMTFASTCLGVLVFAVGPIFAVLYSILFIISVAVCLKLSYREFRGQEDMQGKVVLVTGAASGIGRQTALELARRGARVLIADIDITVAKQTARFITKSTGNSLVEAHYLNLGSFDSVRQFSAKILKNEKRLDVLLNNAGVLRIQLPRAILTKDGQVDPHYAVNYLGPFLLTNLLLPLLKRSAPSRIIMVTSCMHSFGDMESVLKHGFQWHPDENPEEQIYNNSKLALLIFALELSRRLNGTGVTANALHPGLAFTKIIWSFPAWKLVVYRVLCILFFKNDRQAAQTSLYLAVSDEIMKVSGKYFVDCQTAEPASCCMNLELGFRLWLVSQRVTGLNRIKMYRKSG